jgi:phosphohistidine phosphatase
MLTLSLLRHAKSSWDDPGLADRERPLGKRGLRDAPRMSGVFAAHGLRPDLVLCSPSVRTRETLALSGLSSQAVGQCPPVLFEDPLYLAGAQALLARVRQVPRGVQHLLVIGHNPGLHELAVSMARAAGSGGGEAMAQRFPTAALAVIDVSAGAWEDVQPGTGTLRLFVAPRDLGC